MKCVHINSRRALIIIVSFLINSVKYTEMGEYSVFKCSKRFSFVLFSILKPTMPITWILPRKTTSKRTRRKKIISLQSRRRLVNTRKKSNIIVFIMFVLQKDQILPCPANYECNRLNPPCIKCKFDYNCFYGKDVNVTCEAENVVNCKVSCLQPILLCKNIFFFNIKIMWILMLGFVSL